jgi:large subunit ribosomal protein L4
MATVNIVTVQNSRAGSIELPPAVFEVKVKPDLFHAGCAASSPRATPVRTAPEPAHGVGRWLEAVAAKGTGRARQGGTRSPQWSGGGVVFGPVPRSYEHSLSKKVRRAALRGALAAPAEGAITVVAELALSEFKTKRVAGITHALGLAGQSVLIVIAEADEKVETSARNLPRVGVIRAEGLNVYDVLRHRQIVLTVAAVEAIDARLSEERRKTAKRAESS